MSRKHHVRKLRSKSRYPKRLAARGLTATPRMPAVEKLRERQDAWSCRFTVTSQAYRDHVEYMIWRLFHDKTFS